MLGGLIKGMENDGLVKMFGLLIPIVSFIFSNLEHNLLFTGKGSKTISFPSLKN
jgi:hypothetical protein